MIDGNTPWNEDFEKLLRAALPLITPEVALLPDARLLDYGLDSIGVVSLLIDVETHFEIQIPDEALSPETFQDPASLWHVVSATLAAS